MSTQHTPGPWKYYAKLSGSENHKGFRITSNTKNGWALAEVQPGDEDGRLGEANARRIVLCCNVHDELLAALQGLVRANVEWNISVEKIVGRTIGWSSEYLNAAHAAIAKATGSEK